MISKTDNGPPFQSYKISKFLADRNIRHRKITPLWPRANAICERFMRNLNRVMRNSYITGKNLRVEFDIFLINYRATLHDRTGVSPAKLMFNTRASSSHLPVYFRAKKDDSELEKLARINVDKAKQVIQFNMDKKMKAKGH